MPNGHDPLLRSGEPQAQYRPAVLHRLRYLRARLPHGLHFPRTRARSGPGLAGTREAAGPRLGARPAAAETRDSGVCGVAGSQDRWKWLLVVILSNEESVHALPVLWR